MTTAGLDNESLELILQTLKDLGRDLLTPELCLEWDAKDQLPEDLIRKMLSPDVGLHLVFLPEECGGLGGGARDIYRVSEEMAKLDLGIATAFLAIALGSDPLRVGANEEQRQRWLGRVAEEGLIVAYAVTEPEAGSNVAALKTVAEPVMDGGRVVAFRSSNTSQVILEDLELPADQLIGLEEGKGLAQANEVFGFTRLMVAAFGLGGGEAAMERAIAYSKERKQFGKPLCALKGFTHKLLLPHIVRLEAARSYIEEVARRLDSGEPGLQTEGSIAKLYASEAGNAAAEAAIQALGGYGYTREYLVEKIKRDVRITTIYEGTSEIQQSIIYLFRFRQVVRSKGTFYSEQAAQVAELGDEVAGGLVAATARALDHALYSFHKAKISRGQNIQFRLADRITELEHAMAFCRRAANTDDPGLRAACRVFAAEAAGRLALGAVRILTGSGADPGAIDELRRAIDFDGLITTRAGSYEDQARVVEWLLEE
jgi:alkylation response protein AidB-like acyl-CoA dehydrogenase